MSETLRQGTAGGQGTFIRSGGLLRGRHLAAHTHSRDQQQAPALRGQALVEREDQIQVAAATVERPEALKKPLTPA